ncbi:rRNA pseudouridine synthase [Microcoleus sp. FACHB-1515]|uniref:pseudouridine synthase n=1 Tax=Cyanophyceae TaxID=3028117 RepID=UPI001688AE6D|nr:pseudouridine synthase [Microcoleus sp. FACHB-1515]MBD2091374.1 rRNA pseudouridine synthase [Microcoleus sp. FACHB-1515]
MDERLQKILSQWGVASRRQAEQLIRDGRVRLNGAVAELGHKADPSHDRIEVDGRLIQPRDRPAPQYLLLHKPAGVVTTRDDPQKRRTVMDLLPASLKHNSLHPVGRLDADSTGALLLTNDGEVTFCLTHPRHSIAKTYQVWVEGHPTETTLEQWRRGVLLDGRLTRSAQVEVLRQTSSQTFLKIILREGRNRQIRRVAEQLGHPVVSLHRVAIGAIELGSLPSGQVRPLNAKEVEFLRSQVQQLRSIEADLFISVETR